jgi:hypothetical protein
MFTEVTDSLAQCKQLKKDMRFGTWNVKRDCSTVSLKSPARELANYNLYLGLYEVRWYKGVVNQQIYNFFYGKGNVKHRFGMGFPSRV